MQKRQWKNVAECAFPGSGMNGSVVLCSTAGNDKSQELLLAGFATCLALPEVPAAGGSESASTTRAPQDGTRASPQEGPVCGLHHASSFSFVSRCRSTGLFRNCGPHFPGPRSGDRARPARSPFVRRPWLKRIVPPAPGALDVLTQEHNAMLVPNGFNGMPGGIGEA